MPALTPPIEHRKALLALAQMSDLSYDALKHAVSTREAPPVEEGVEGDGPSSEEENSAMSVIDTLFTMHSVKTQYNLDVEDFIESVSEGLESASTPVFSSSELSKAIARLGELIGIDGPLTHSSKVSDVVRDHENTFCTCRVLTDVRPIFGDDAEEPPIEFAVLHTIKLAYHHGSERRELFIAADADDLAELREAIDRAESKEATLTSVLSEKGFTITEIG